MRVSSKNILLLSLAAYLVNSYYAFAPGYALGLYSLGGGAIWLFYQCGWRESLVYTLCYGTFLALLSVTVVIGWLFSAVRPLAQLYHACTWLFVESGQGSLLSSPIPNHD